MTDHAHTAAQRPARPVLARGVPLGRARTRNGAVKLALRFASPIDRMLLEAGYRLQAREDHGRFRVTLAK